MKVEAASWYKTTRSQAIICGDAAPICASKLRNDVFRCNTCRASSLHPCHGGYAGTKIFTTFTTVPVPCPFQTISSIFQNASSTAHALASSAHALARSSTAIHKARQPVDIRNRLQQTPQLGHSRVSVSGSSVKFLCFLHSLIKPLMCVEVTLPYIQGPRQLLTYFQKGMLHAVALDLSCL